MRPDLEALANVIVALVCRELEGMEAGELPGREDESQPGVFVATKGDYEREYGTTPAADLP